MWWAAAQPEPVDAYLTLPRPGEGIAQSMQVVAALKPGATVQQAQSELNSLEQHLGRTENLRVEPLDRQLGGASRKTLLILMAAGACVLLIAIVNVANLLLARATLRYREVAIRAAVGAGRGRVLRQMLAESLLQSLAGGAAGLLLARGAIAVLIGISPYAVPRLAETTIDARVLLFTLALSVAAGLAFGALPALTLRRGDLQEALKSGTRNTSTGGGLRVRRCLVAAELALAIVLLTGAGLMLKSFARMNAHAPGFDPDDVAVMKVRFTGGRDPDAFVRDLLRRLDTLPGVRAAGVSCWIQQNQRINAVSPGYLKAFGMRLRKGRWLADNEAHAALINESMARRTFAGLDPVGRQVLLPRPYTVVGVVADVKYTRLDADPPPEVYVPIERAPDLYGLEIAATPKSILPALRREVQQIDPSLPVFDVKTLGEALAQSIAPRRFNLFLLGGFAAAALLLAVVGIYGVTAYSVAERTREIGMRMALGARRSQVAAMVVREAVPYALAGIAAGLIATWALAAVLASLLYDVQPTDPATYAGVAILLTLVAVTACLGPAWKAASIDPLVALRQVG
jgi:putative ABC transport system permease protein